ncbi:MAG: hypothetical protein WD404_02020 [Solirubrobacterales bacterium]
MQPPVRLGRVLAKLAHLDALVRGSDLLLHLVHGKVSQLAAGALLATEADEVVVDAAGLALAFDEGEVFAAVAAQAALEVVAVLAVALAGHRMGIEHALHLIEGLLVDQRFVATLVLHPGVGDDPDVVLGAQQPRDLAARERLGRMLAGRPGAQAAPFERRLHRVEGVGAGGERGERPADVRSPVGVDFHGADLAAVDHLADVEVADPHVSRRAADFGLAVQALLDLGREVQRVVLGDGGEDAVSQATRGRPVDALGSRHQLRARLHDLEQHVGVVAAIAREAVDFVDDDVGGRLARAQPGQQLPERRAVRVRRRLGRVDELLAHLRFKLRRFAVAVGALGLDRVALLREGAPDLPLAGNAEIQPGGRLHVRTSVPRLRPQQRSRESTTSASPLSLPPAAFDVALKLPPIRRREFVAELRLKIRPDARQVVGGAIARQSEEVGRIEVEGAGDPLELLGVGAGERAALQAHDRGAVSARRVAEGFEGQPLARPLAGDELAERLEIAGHGHIVSL